MQRDSEFFDFWLHSSFFMPLVKLITSDASSNIIMRSSGNRFSPFKISLFLKTKYLTNVWVWPRNSMQDSIVQIQLQSQAKNQANNSLAVSGWKGRAQQLVTKHILLQKCYRCTTAMKPVINNKYCKLNFVDGSRHNYHTSYCKHQQNTEISVITYNNFPGIAWAISQINKAIGPQQQLLVLSPSN